MLQKLPVNKFEWIKDTSQFNEDFINVYNEVGDEGYFHEIDIQHPERMKERMKIEKVEKLVTNLRDEIEYVILIRNLKQALNSGLTS